MTAQDDVLPRRFETLLYGFRKLSAVGSSSGAGPGTLAFSASLLRGYQEAAARQRQVDATDPPINLLEVAGRGRDERLYCSLLAWLLDPLGSHCQGPAFLAAFATYLGLDVPRLELASVSTEVAHEESRIDVEVALRSECLIHIEAKVDSGEGVDQAPREWRDLVAKAATLGVPAESARAVYLTRLGESATSEKLLPMSWSDVADALRPALEKSTVHAKVRALAGHVLECFSALTHGGQMGSFALNETDKYLLSNQAEVLALMDSWSQLERRILGRLTEKAWLKAIADEGVPGRWEVYLTKGSGQPLFRRDDWYKSPSDDWTCIDTGSFNLRGFLSAEPEEQAWVGLWWNKLRESFDEKDLASRAKKWMAKMPGSGLELLSDKGHGIWWRLRLPIKPDAESLSELPRLIVREWARLSPAFDEIAEMSRLTRKRLSAR